MCRKPTPARAGCMSVLEACWPGEAVGLSKRALEIEGANFWVDDPYVESNTEQDGSVWATSEAKELLDRTLWRDRRRAKFREGDPSFTWTLYETRVKRDTGDTSTE